MQTIDRSVFRRPYTVNGAACVTCAMALLGPSSVARAQQVDLPEDPSVFGGVSFPSQIGDFTAMRATRWPDPALGVGITYRIDGFPGEFSVYVYPASKELAAEFEQAMEGISIYAEQSRDGVSVEVESSEATAVGDIAGFVGVSHLSGPRGDSRSLLYLFERDGHFFKYRVSYEPAMRSMLEEPLADFLRTTLESIGLPGA